MLGLFLFAGLRGCICSFVFAEGSSITCPAYLDASIFAFNYFYWGYYDGFPRGTATGICPVKAWNRNRSKQPFTVKPNHTRTLPNLLYVKEIGELARIGH